MTITYQGDNYFKIKSGDDLVLVDPEDQRSFKKADMALNTIKPTLTEPPSKKDLFWCDHAGEYEVEGTRIRGWYNNTGEYRGERRQKTVYRLDFKSFRFVIFGFLAEELDPDIFEYMQEVDVAIIPAGNDELINPSDAAQIIRQVEPSLVVPSFNDELDKFLKELNKKSCEKEEKIVIKKKDLKPQAMKVRCLQS
ncbi:MAG: MBL fold metallo-hydrolase [Candidatus Magasanikbacteria bacterium]